MDFESGADQFAYRFIQQGNEIVIVQSVIELAMYVRLKERRRWDVGTLRHRCPVAPVAVFSSERNNQHDSHNPTCWCLVCISTRYSTCTQQL